MTAQPPGRPWRWQRTIPEPVNPHWHARINADGTIDQNIRAVCGNCRYSNPTIMGRDDEGDPNPTPVLECRRYPPTFVTDHDGPAVAWLQIQADDWCGEWDGQVHHHRWKPEGDDTLHCYECGQSRKIDVDG